MTQVVGRLRQIQGEGILLLGAGHARDFGSLLLHFLFSLPFGNSLYEGAVAAANANPRSQGKISILVIPIKSSE